LEGITSRVKIGSQVLYSPGTTLDQKNVNPVDWSSGEASTADVNIVVMGLTRHLEGEEGESISSPYFGDRIDYDLPQNQIDYLKKVKGEHGKPVVVIITGGCPMNLSEVHQIADAVLFAWYPGEEGGNAAADILFGNVSPSGRLPLTFPKSLDQLPPYEDYSMDGRTYRYMKKEPMYPFGFGLGYASFAYSNIELSSERMSKNQAAELTCTVTNTSDTAGEELVQLYVTIENEKIKSPLLSLKGVQRIELKPGESKRVLFEILPEMLMIVDEQGKPVFEKGNAILQISGSLPIQRSQDLGAADGQAVSLSLK
jgi:beta-glucosidase